VASFMRGGDIVALASEFGWIDAGPGANHPHILKREGDRPVPVRARLDNRFEVQSGLKQLGVPRTAWPEKVK
jgi:hypothetical protein